MSIGLKSDSSGTSGSIVINGSDAVLVTPTGITTASIQNSSITTAKIASGNITFNTLSTSSTEADNVAKRTAKAWINFNGTGTPAIRDDFNVSSITDNGTGDYTINFSSALASADYCAVMSQQSDPANGPDCSAIFYARTPNTVSNPTTSLFRVSTLDASGNARDRAYVLISVFL